MLYLLGHSDVEISKEAYKQAHTLITKTIRINYSKYIDKSFPGYQVLFFLRPEIIIELASYGLTNKNIQVCIKH